MRKLLLSTLALSWVGMSLQAQPPEVEVWALPAVAKVRSDDRSQSSNLVWSEAEKKVRIAGAGNEHVPFQLVVSVPPPPNRYTPAAEGFWVEATAPAGPAGTLPADAISIYLEVPVLVYAKSSPVGDTGFWPDALAPLTDPFGMAAPFRQALRNRAVWIDVEIPSGTPPGTFEGAIRVSQEGELLETVKLELEVYGFSLPDETHLITYMGVSEGAFRTLDPEGADPERRAALMRSYHDFLYRNRMEPWFNPLLQPEISLTEGGEVALEFDEALYRHYMDVLKTKRVILETVPRELAGGGREPEQISEETRRRVASYIRQVVAYFERHEWLDRLVFNSPIDEPNTAEHYQRTREWADLVHEINPDLSFLATESPVPDLQEWGPLTGYVNDFSVHGNKLNDREVKKAISREREEGGEISWYVSCDQKYPQPNYFIDASPMDPVMIPWVTRRYGIDGILYWSVNYWFQTPNPWLDPVTYLSGFFCSDGWVLSGEGSLVYPGNYTRQYSGQADVEGPVSSMRLELLREGIEDYEYLWLVESLGDGDFADRIVSDLVVDVSAFSRNVEDLFAARVALARRIEALMGSK